MARRLRRRRPPCATASTSCSPADTEELRVLDRLARLEAVEKDGQPVLAGKHAHELVVRGDRDDPRRHRQVQRRRLVVVVAFMGQQPCQAEGMVPRREAQAMNVRCTIIAHEKRTPRTGFVRSVFGMRLSQVLSSQRQASSCSTAGRAKGQSRDKGIGGRRRRSGGAPCIGSTGRTGTRSRQAVVEASP